MATVDWPKIESLTEPGRYSLARIREGNKSVSEDCSYKIYKCVRGGGAGVDRAFLHTEREGRRA
jgi:hypothetical protein